MLNRPRQLKRYLKNKNSSAEHMQVVNVTVNKRYKADIQKQSEEHLQQNLDAYTNGKITAAGRRVLITDWCGNAWSRIDRESGNMSFKKLGLSVALDGSESYLANIPKIPTYDMPPMAVESEYVLEESDSDTDGSLSSDDESDLIETTDDDTTDSDSTYSSTYADTLEA